MKSIASDNKFILKKNVFKYEYKNRDLDCIFLIYVSDLNINLFKDMQIDITNDDLTSFDRIL